MNNWERILERNQKEEISWKQTDLGGTCTKSG